MNQENTEEEDETDKALRECDEYWEGERKRNEVTGCLIFGMTIIAIVVIITAFYYLPL